MKKSIVGLIVGGVFMLASHAWANGEPLLISPSVVQAGDTVTLTVTGIPVEHNGHIHTLYHSVAPDGSGGMPVEGGSAPVVSGTWQVTLSIGPTTPPGVFTLALRHDEVTPPYVSGIATITFLAVRISGTVRMTGDGSNSPLAGVTMVTSFGEPVVTDANGEYVITLIKNGGGTITPTKAGVDFQPPSRNYPNVLSDMVNEDFNGTPAGGGGGLGAPTGIRFAAQQQTGFTLEVYQAVVQTADEFGNRAGNAISPIYVTLEAVALDPTTKLPQRPSATMTLFTDASGTQVLSGPLLMNSGTSALTLYYKETVPGVSRIRATTQISGQGAELDIVSLGGGLSGVSIDTGTPGTATVVTLTPDFDGVDDFAFVNFTLEREADWQVIVDTNRDGTFAESFNWNVAGDVAYYGRAVQNRIQIEPRDNRFFRPLPNGTYPIRIALGSWEDDPTTGSRFVLVPGSIVNTLSFVVSSSVLTGTVYDNLGNKVQNAQVQVGGASYGFSETDANGAFTISGLKAGPHNVNVRRSGFSEKNLEVTLSASGETSLAVTLDKGSTLRVAWWRSGPPANTRLKCGEGWKCIPKRAHSAGLVPFTLPRGTPLFRITGGMTGLTPITSRITRKSDWALAITAFSCTASADWAWGRGSKAAKPWLRRRTSWKPFLSPRR